MNYTLTQWRVSAGGDVTRYVHLWQRVGKVVEPMVKLRLAVGETRSIKVDFIYPPDATPPQVLTVRTLEELIYLFQSLPRPKNM